MYYPRFTKGIIHYFFIQDKTVSWRNKIGMHTFKDDYLINTLRFVSAKEATQIYGAILPESLTSPEMKETKAYKTYLGFATGATPPKKAKSKRVKRPAKKSTKSPTGGVVIRETTKMSLSKKKEKMTIEKRKGIDLLSEVALTEEAHSGTVTKIAPSAAKIKPSVTNKETGVIPGVPDVTEEESTESEAESWGNGEDNSNDDHDSSGEDSNNENDNDDDKTQSDNENQDPDLDNLDENESDSMHETNKNESGSDSDQKENEEEIEDDEEEEDDEFVKTPSMILMMKMKQRLKIKLEEGTNAELTNIQQRNENLEITHDQVIEDAHVTISTIAKKTEVPVTSSSYSSDLAAKFLNFADIPTTEAKIVSPMDVPVYHEVPSGQTPTLLTVPVSVITESSPVYTTNIPQLLQSFTPPPLLSTPTPPPTTKATNPQSGDLLKTQVTALVDEHLDARLGATRDEFMNYLSASITARITDQSTYKAASSLIEFELKKILIEKMDESQSYLTAPEHKECYNGLIKSYDLDKSLFSTYDKVYSLKRSRKDKDKDEDPSTGSDRGLKKRKTSKDVEPKKCTKAKESQSGSSKGAQSQSKSSGKSVQSEEPEFEVADSDMP
ncbi:hypothetical protein Tco_0764551 [Tanacetum coccineum]